jgi:hypothetical protein
MGPDSELVPVALDSWLEESLKTKLGRCRRCMGLSGGLVVLSWALVFALANMEPLLPALLVTVTAFAVPITLLAAAHLGAVAIRVSRSYLAHAEDVPAQPDQSDPALAPAPARRPSRRGCGCGGGAGV